MDNNKEEIRTNKKRNMRYWDGIDGTIEQMVLDVA